MDGDQFSSWRANHGERRRAVSAALQVASAFTGGLWAPFLVWGLEFVYDRRDLIFDRRGAPARAYTAARLPLRLSSLATATGTAQTATLSITAPLTAAAQQLDLRGGDPVSVVVSGHQYVRDRSGLVIPPRIGDRVDVSVPYGNYSLAAFGGRREALFSTKDPYSMVAGGNVSVTGRGQFDLSLVKRNTVLPAVPTAGLVGRPTSATIQPWLVSPGFRRCAVCGARVANMLQHVHTCPMRVRYCPRCGVAYRSAATLENHRSSAHATVWDRFLRFIALRVPTGSSTR